MKFNIEDEALAKTSKMPMRIKLGQKCESKPLNYRLRALVHVYIIIAFSIIGDIEKMIIYFYS